MNDSNDIDWFEIQAMEAAKKPTPRRKSGVERQTARIEVEALSRSNSMPLSEACDLVGISLEEYKAGKFGRQSRIDYLPSPGIIYANAERLRQARPNEVDRENPNYGRPSAYEIG